MISRFASLLASLAMVVGTAALAQAVPPPTGGPYVMQKHAIAAGGQRASGGAYVLTGTIGQSDASAVRASGSTYDLAGGFHVRELPLDDHIFRSGFEQ